ncbi:SDR family NAD(P)-dependent oxidoreductase [Algoriphagus sediminis]|uniref:Glucose 1-dehydrogenase n=1 Tax=Algoriphagus sediminis TaxID=3057113 RepID=A0ABT7YFS1_9BACT|nr:glucose 1-dehydrogenase [Algoriphagus sediminis]MDN3205360.1 glucose 1-dehydrogenase [Algoriphagus sediminis]
MAKTAIITGAGQGIGFAIAKKLSQKGINIILNDLEKSLAEEAAKSISSETKHPVLAIGGDASREEIISGMIDLAISDFQSLDIVVANAGITLFGGFLDYTREDFREVTRVNQEGTFFLTQAAAKVMSEQESGGAILFTSSVTAHSSHENLGAYSMSKAALEMLAKNLVLELAPLGIRVNTVAPGATLTSRTAMDETYESTWSRITPLKKPASIEDIANAAAFLVSDEASHITGQSLVVDGGWTSVSPSPYE